MNSDDSRIVELKNFRRRAYNKATDAIEEATWHALADVWFDYANAIENVPPLPGGLRLSGSPSAVFSTLAGNLVAMAQALKVDNDDILETLLSAALVECKPKGRLYQLLHKASNLLEDGDEDSWEKSLRAMHASGKKDCDCHD